jgi:hypothetical protein
MRSIFAPVLSAALVALSLSACSSTVDPGSRVTTERVLAVEADKPYARPGDTVKLDALAFDPAGRSTTYAWTYCVNPEQSTATGCLAALAQSKSPPPFVLSPDPTFTLTVPSDALSSLPQGGRASASIGVLIVACPGALTVGPGTLTPSYGLPYTCTSDGRALDTHEAILGVKRIFVREKDTNANPSIAQVTWDGAAWPASEIKDVSGCAEHTNTYEECIGEEHHVAAIAADGASESGVDENGTSFQEQLVVEYYATEGIFEHEVMTQRDPTTGWKARDVSRGKTVTMWLVLRDNRGGVSWATRQIRVNP